MPSVEAKISPTVFAFLPLSCVCLQNLLLNCYKPPEQSASQPVLAFSKNQSVLIKIIMSFESEETNKPKAL